MFTRDDIQEILGNDGCQKPILSRGSRELILFVDMDYEPYWAVYDVDTDMTLRAHSDLDVVISYIGDDDLTADDIFLITQGASIEIAMINNRRLSLVITSIDHLGLGYEWLVKTPNGIVEFTDLNDALACLNHD